MKNCLNLLASISVRCLAIVTAAVAFQSSAHAIQQAGTEMLAREAVYFSSSNGDTVLLNTAADLRSFFQRFHPAVDSSSRILSGPVVSGSTKNPRLQVSIQKCVLVICKTVELDSYISAAVVHGPCARNLIVTTDLTRSSQILSGLYDALEVHICLNPNSQYGSELRAVAVAHQAPTYSRGPIQRTALQILQLQAPNMIQALKESLAINGAQVY